MNFMKVSCVIAQAQCVTNWADKERLRARLTFETMKQLRDGPLEKLWGGGGEFSSRRNFFSLSNSLYGFFLGHSMNIFLGLIGVLEFFFILFSLARIFFLYFARPLPHKFSNGPSLRKTYLTFRDFQCSSTNL